jgi:hypothetical protein
VPLGRAIAVALLLITGTLLLAKTAAAQQVSEAERVLEQFERALNAYNEDALVSLAAVDGTLLDSQGRPVTEQEVRAMARAMRDRNYHFHFSNYSTQEGKTRFSVEAGQGEWYVDGAAPDRGIGIAEVRGGRIVMLSMEADRSTAASATVASVGRTATPPSPFVTPLLAIGAGGLLALALGFVRWRLRPRAGAAADAVVAPGGLHANLGAWAARRRDLPPA